MAENCKLRRFLEDRECNFPAFPPSTDPSIRGRKEKGESCPGVGKGELSLSLCLQLLNLWLEEGCLGGAADAFYVSRQLLFKFIVLHNSQCNFDVSFAGWVRP